jgi:hypothetical protein
MHLIAVFLKPLSREMVRKSRRAPRRRQHGGGFAFDGPAYPSPPGFAPEAARNGYDDCTMGVSRPAPQIGGACTTCGVVMAPQRGGGGGSGGYSMVFSNDIGKVHAGYITGDCPPARQVGGAADGLIVSNPSGYGYDASSPFSTPNQSAHFLEYKGYGQQCMGGGARRSRRHRSRRHRSRSRRHRPRRR